MKRTPKLRMTVITCPECDGGMDVPRQNRATTCPHCAAPLMKVGRFWQTRTPMAPVNREPPPRDGIDLARQLMVALGVVPGRRPVIPPTEANDRGVYVPLCHQCDNPVDWQEAGRGETYGSWVTGRRQEIKKLVWNDLIRDWERVTVFEIPERVRGHRCRLCRKLDPSWQRINLPK